MTYEANIQVEVPCARVWIGKKIPQLRLEEQEVNNGWLFRKTNQKYHGRLQSEYVTMKMRNTADNSLNDSRLKSLEFFSSGSESAT